MRLLHTMLRVTDMDKSIDFYTNLFGMELLRKKEFPEGKFTLAFLGYGSEEENTVQVNRINEDTNLPYLNIFLQKGEAVSKATQALIDTGCDGSIISINELQKMNLNRNIK